jgi:hypothetical protein
MANLTETKTFDAGIYRIETTDQVIGGETGISNKSAKGLANRTKYLKERITSGIIAKSGLTTRVTHDMNIPAANQCIQLTYRYTEETEGTFSALGVFGTPDVNYFDIYSNYPAAVIISWTLIDTR